MVYKERKGIQRSDTVCGTQIEGRARHFRLLKGQTQWRNYQKLTAVSGIHSEMDLNLA